MTKTKSQKSKELETTIELISNYPTIGVVNIEKMPAAQLQQIKKRLRTKLEIKVIKNLIITRALEDCSSSKPNINTLRDHISGQTALIGSSLNPFKLFKEATATKLKMPAKGGELATEDIIVSGGETNLKPGPVVGELQKAGIPASIEKGKVIIKYDKALVKKGERIPRDAAVALTRLEILPLTIGLDLKAAYESGIVFTAYTLAFDEEKLKRDIQICFANALNLALNLNYITNLTVKLLIHKAYNDALNLGIKAEIITSETVKLIVQNAYAKALAMRSKLK